MCYRQLRLPCFYRDSLELNWFMEHIKVSPFATISLSCITAHPFRPYCAPLPVLLACQTFLKYPMYGKLLYCREESNSAAAEWSDCLIVMKLPPSAVISI